ncbi:MAG TPA: methyltransferase domain-containing protein [Pseudonocardiaceae bacterium]|nr:methyltransferase domain-containing protein [Pseudonocardiaceae bacterium]
MTETEGLTRIQAALTARAALKTWSEGAELIALLRAAHEAGWLTRLRDDATARDLAADLPVSHLENVLSVFTAAGVTEGREGVFRLTPAFDALVAGTSSVDLGETLDTVDLARARISSPGPLTGAQALVLARDWAIGPNEDAEPMYQALYQAVPEYRALLEAGGPLLDIGCGVAGASLTTAILFPRFRAVGVEIVPEVAAEARRRAEAVGVADRVEIRAADARTLTEESVFAQCFWAQPFFEPGVRAEVLAVIFRALRPGGLLLVQELFPPVSEEDEANVRVRLDRLFVEQHGASYGRSAEALAAEAAEAGFVDAQIVSSPFGRLVLTRKPA